MHEASIALEIVALIEEQALLHGANRVSGVGVRLGELSSVVPEALEFVWADTVRGSVAEGASLHIERVPAIAECPTHGGVRLVLTRGLRCPICSLPTPKVLQGEELELDTLELL